MLIRALFILAAGVGIFTWSPAQEVIPGNNEINESLLESVAGEVSPDEYEALLKELEYIREHPFDLNRVSRDELESLPFLTAFQINSFLEYRNTKGKLISIYELQVIYGFSQEVIEQLLPYVTLPEANSPEALQFKDLKGKPVHAVYLRMQRVIEKSAGYGRFDSASGANHYPGNPWMMNLHYEFKLKNHVRAGFTVEKDPGENLFKESNRNGFDFNSGFVMIEQMGFLKTLIAGDYRLAFGQGLTLWSGAGAGKSSLALNTVKRQDSPKAFTSNDENNYFRGIAASTVYRNFTLSLFFSSKKRDANITDTLDGKVYFSSFQESGYHRTTAEIHDERSVRETMLGGNIHFRNSFMKVGATLVSCTFDKHMEAGDDPGDRNDFSGNYLMNAGLDYSLNYRKIQAFGEFSYGNEKFATLHGLLMHVNKYAAFSLVYRNFAPGYFALHSSAFSERADDSNEEGFYVGTVLHPVADISIAAYADFYRFPWLKYNTSAPSSGSDYLLQADYTPGKVKMLLRFRAGSDPEDYTDVVSEIPVLTETRTSGIRYNIAYPVQKRLVMQNRIEVVKSNPEFSRASYGFMVYHDIAWIWHSLPLELDGRVAYFNTDDYSSRIYAYEQDLTAGFSFSPLYDEGLRLYLMAVYTPGKNMTVGIRYSRSQYFNKDELGSGADTILSDAKNDIKLRVSVKF